jgi:cell wall-associated protease
MKFFLSLAAALVCTFTGIAQAKQKLNGWHLMDFDKDGYMGISLDKAYNLLKGRQATTVIVAVIDSGIDTLQEDLTAVLWKNEKEVSGNGKDDDGNGYIDDIHGWNFDGAGNGENLAHNSHEAERVYHGWKKEFDGKKEKEIPADKKYLYNQWTKAAAIINKDYDDAVKELPGVSDFLTALQNSSKIICTSLSVNEFTPGQLYGLMKNPDAMVAKSAALWIGVYTRANDTSAKNTEVIKEVSNYKERLDKNIRLKTEVPENWRGDLIKDKYEDINDRFYGNNNLKSGSGDHGTLVSGIIGAVRNNGIGINGIADNVRIMAVRAVPGGDEHDKDVALAIYYAVNNGAKIINMSFGKPVSPYKQLVDDAIQYAASKGVLLVHASGNDGKDISKDIFYPNPFFLDGKRATNYLNVGASGDASTGGYVASFSNYSKEWVDIFAPGMNIYSTASDNRYEAADGTSVASPVATGVAALLKSYFPELSPEQIIHIITASGITIDQEVSLPGNQKKKVKFSSLSSSGKLINAYEAVKMALEMEKK